MLTDIKSAVLALGLGVVIILLVSYLAYMVGLILVLRRMGRLTWMAFVPLLNYYAQVRSVGAPSRWFLLSMPPYIGTVYAAAVAIRLGKVFDRGIVFSVTWLTVGAPIGMFIIAFSKQPPKLSTLLEPAVLIDLKKINAERAAQSRAKKAAKAAG